MTWECNCGRKYDSFASISHEVVCASCVRRYEETIGNLQLKIHMLTKTFDEIKRITEWLGGSCEKR